MERMVKSIEQKINQHRVCIMVIHELKQSPPESTGDGEDWGTEMRSSTKQEHDGPWLGYAVGL
jgi:hypothetical protein